MPTTGNQPGLSGTDFLYQVARILLSECDYGELLSELLDITIKGLGAERGFVLVRDGDGFRATVARNYRAESLARAEQRVSSAIVSMVAEQSRAVLLGDAQQEPTLRSRPSVQALSLRSVLCAPLVATSEASAVIYLENRSQSDCFTEGHRAALDEICQIASSRLRAAVAIELSRRRASDFSTAGPGSDGLITADAKMGALLETVRQLASADLPVLIQGETGTGKELVARMLYRYSKRSTGPFVVLNCGAIPSSLIGSELFGYVRGAFTGANQNRMGFIAAAHRGTLFLDEIGELPLELQPQLLRVLQSGEFARLGSVQTEHSDVRFLAATNRELEREADEGRFRSDLFYRLSGITVKIPPLRDRVDDIPLLAAHFIAQYSNRLARPTPELTSGALKTLSRYSFPGNVRELENEMARLVATTPPGGRIAEDSLSARVRGLSPPNIKKESVPLMSLAEMEKLLIHAALEHTGGNRTRASELLGITREGLRMKLRRLGLDES